MPQISFLVLTIAYPIVSYASCVCVPIALTILCYTTTCSVIMRMLCCLVTAGKISVAMDTTEELFRTDEEHR